jgi:hypothetical protein
MNAEATAKLTLDFQVERISMLNEEFENEVSEILINYQNKVRELHQTSILDNEGDDILRPGAYESQLSDFALRFISMIVSSVSPKAHLDPWLKTFSPAMFFDLPNTTAFCINEQESNALKKLKDNSSMTIKTGHGLQLLDSYKGSVDLITSIPPLGAKVDKTLLDAEETELSEIRDLGSMLIAKSCSFLSDHGVGIFLVANSFFTSKKPEIYLNNHGLKIDAIFSLPEGSLTHTSIQSNLIIVKKGESPTTYYSELSDDQDLLKDVYHSYINNDGHDDPKAIPKRSYIGALPFRIGQELQILETQYKSFKSYRLGDVSNMTKGNPKTTFEHIENSIYIPSIGKSNVVTDLEAAPLKHQNYIQLALDSNLVSSEYMEVFFRSTMGRLILASNTKGETLPYHSFSNLFQLPIPIPSKEIQENITVTQKKLEKLQHMIEEISQELALNPPQSSITDQIDKMIDVMGGLTEADKVRALARQGEGETIEFKETLTWDTRQNIQNAEVTKAALKTIVGFLNTKGGTLLIGVADSGKMSGVNLEIEKLHKSSTDKFLLSLKNLLKDRIGAQYYPFIGVSLINADGVFIVRINCKTSNEPCFLLTGKGGNKVEEFYVRAPAATDKLEGREMLKFIDANF